jgi:forespore regulator of the sigma-K checkpoint
VFRFRMLKEWKKKLKRKRRHIWSLGTGAAIFLLAAIAGTFGASRLGITGFTEKPTPEGAVSVWMDKSPATSRERVLDTLKERKGDIEIVLHLNYLCGEETRMLGRRSALEAKDLLMAHRDWEARFDSTDRIVMDEVVDDLSPQCRETARIGMDEDGNLSLYDGLPQQENVIRTFFQLDVETMQTALSQDKLKQLADGIRVSDRNEYNSVLSTYSDYAMNRSESVMNAPEQPSDTR